MLVVVVLAGVEIDAGADQERGRDKEAPRPGRAEEQRRRVLQALFQDVRRAFWRAASAQRLNSDVRDTIRDAQKALEASRKGETLRAPIDALRYQKALLDALRDLEFVQQQLAVSKTELAALINLPPGTVYSLAAPRNLKIESPRMPVRQMEEVALVRNPDVREASYQVRISVNETRKMLARNLPGVVVLGGDVHSNYVADLKADFDDARSAVVASEFCGTSITSLGLAQSRIDAARPFNPHIRFGRSDQRGYMSFVLDAKQLRARLQSVDRPADPASGITTVASFVVDAARPGAHRGGPPGEARASLPAHAVVARLRT